MGCARRRVGLAEAREAEILPNQGFACLLRCGAGPVLGDRPPYVRSLRGRRESIHGGSSKTSMFSKPRRDLTHDGLRTTRAGVSNLRGRFGDPSGISALTCGSPASAPEAISVQAASVRAFWGHALIPSACLDDSWRRRRQEGVPEVEGRMPATAASELVRMTLTPERAGTPSCLRRRTPDHPNTSKGPTWPRRAKRIRSG
jgi:hypothetical protein